MCRCSRGGKRSRRRGRSRAGQRRPMRRPQSRLRRRRQRRGARRSRRRQGRPRRRPLPPDVKQRRTHGGRPRRSSARDSSGRRRRACVGRWRRRRNERRRRRTQRRCQPPILSARPGGALEALEVFCDHARCALGLQQSLVQEARELATAGLEAMLERVTLWPTPPDHPALAATAGVAAPAVDAPTPPPARRVDSSNSAQAR